MADKLEKIHCIILGAGHSSRMKSKVSKIFHDLAGKSVLEHVVSAVQGAQVHDMTFVVSPNLCKSGHMICHQGKLATQEEPLGTADAVQVGLKHLVQRADALSEQLPDSVLIVCGDTPLLNPQSLSNLINTKADMAILVSQLPMDLINSPYGRIITVTDEAADTTYTESLPIKQIIEYKDAPIDVRRISLFNTGVYKVSLAALQTYLSRIETHNASGEYYFTDIVELMHQDGLEVVGKVVDFEETLGINTRQDLERVDALLQKKLKTALQATGVTFLQAETSRVSVDTIIGQDSVIEPHVVIGPKVIIGQDVYIKSFSYLSGCIIEDTAKIGPFAHIRANCLLRKGAEIGNFVEIKNTTLGLKTKAKHLTYLGDCEVGDATNIGAGTITANYDGFFKHKTVIGSHVHIGAQTICIAPVTLENEAMTAAGAIVTESVPEGALAISRIKQVIKPHWAKRYKQLLRKKKEQV